jgi:hypothetical protein
MRMLLLAFHISMPLAFSLAQAAIAAVWILQVDLCEQREQVEGSGDAYELGVTRIRFFL